RAFLKTRLNAPYFKEGEIVDKEGRVLGKHNGTFNYTIGQREGLGISSPHPLYVTRLDSKNNRVVVGPKEVVYSGGLLAEEPNILAPALFKNSSTLKAKIRYNHPEVPARLEIISKNKIKIKFAKPELAVTPGQFLVLYKNDIVVAGAKIINSV
ncbi:MAG TPA: tRNA 2-thiouridine(34) synthase MnmA, partial [Candidatus Omnitrophota bacterium]|nr:tRNA 2-thiouridine(34) synthase MnmA [Candidatus Omnitrophota bacterium]